MGKAPGIENYLRHQIYVFMHSQLREIYHIVSIDGPSEAFGHRIAVGLVIEDIDYEISLLGGCIISFPLVAYLMSVFLDEVKINDICSCFIASNF